jgi:sporulation protein YlmC with PRC-barrel domain
MTDHTFNIVKSDEVIGVDVKDKDKKDIGKIEEIVLDKIAGQVRYVVLSFGGALGLGGKYFALPWKSISYDKADDCFILNTDKSRLKNERGFDKDNWPDMAQWSQTVDSYYS